MANSESWTLLKTISSDLSDLTVSRRGSRPRRCGRTLILVDIASPTAADGRPLVNAVRWLSDRAVEAGGLLDLDLLSGGGESSEGENEKLPHVSS